tara:strand:- start:499748 stop:501316 length:1569 start_codon:yes stop_codon:yes gene_type:complete
MAALKSPAEVQAQQLKLVLSSVGKSPWGQYLGLQSLLSKFPKKADDAHVSFVESTDTMNHQLFIRTLKGVLNFDDAPLSDDAEVLQKPGILTKEKLAGLCNTPFDTGVLPVTESMLEHMKAGFLAKSQELAKQFSTKPHNTFFLYNQPLRRIVGDGLLPACGLGVLLAEREKKMFKGQPAALPDPQDLQAAGHSTMQRLDSFVQLLQKHGKRIEALWGDGRMFADLAHEMKQSSPPHRLLEICPNLKYCLIDSAGVNPNQTGYIDLLGGKDLPSYGAFYSSFGMFGHAIDESTPMYFEPALDAGAYFEFVPLTQVDENTGEPRPTHQRMWVGNVVPDQDYLLIVSNVAGLIAYNTGVVVRVKNTEPLRLRVMGKCEYLNGLNERLSEAQTSDILANFNTAVSRSYKCYVRDYMIGDHVDRGQAIWALELSIEPRKVPPQVLKSLANRLHTELAKTSRHYMKAFDQGGVAAPVMTFLPPGTFMQAARYPLPHLDLTPDAHQVRKLMTFGGDRQVKLRVAKLSL